MIDMSIIAREPIGNWFRCLCVCFKLSLIFVVSKESAGAVDEEDFIKAFTDVPTVQVHYRDDPKGCSGSEQKLFTHRRSFLAVG